MPNHEEKNNQIIVCNTEDEQTKIEIKMQDESLRTIFLTQNMLL